MGVSSIAVLGAGSWGTALAILLARNGHAVRLWTRESEQCAAMQRDLCNKQFLPDSPFPDNLHPVESLAATVEGVADVLVVVPSHGFRQLISALAKLPSPPNSLAWATKGFETPGGKLLHEVVDEVLGSKVSMAVISGPSFATEVAREQPTAVAVASGDGVFADHWCALLHSNTFRTYANSDVIGVQVGGAVKNVMAIAAGISDGLGFGSNARAALVTRGLAEISRMGIALGARAETFTGLAGLGDLMLTCTDDQSRNRRLGLALAQGVDLGRAQRDIGQVVEGVTTASLVARRAAEMGIEMPITEQVDGVLSGRIAPAAAVRSLLSRTVKREGE